MKLLTLAIAAILVVTFTANAQNTPNTTPTLKYAKRYIIEVGGDISYSNTSYHFDETGSYESHSLATQNYFSISANAGAFVMNGLKLGIEPGVTVSSVNSIGKFTTTQLALYLTADYVFNTRSIVFPYVGGAFGYTARIFGSNSDNPTASGLSYGAKAGLKVNFLGNSLFNFGFTYYRQNYDYTVDNQGFHGDYKEAYDIVGLAMGWSVFF